MLRITGSSLCGSLSFHFSLAFESGWDYTDTEGGEKGSLWKLTLAPQVTPALTIMSRPSLRLFVTYVNWSDAFRGLVAPFSYGDDTEGWSLGVHVETRW